MATDWATEIIGWTAVALVMVALFFVSQIGLTLCLAMWAEWRNHRQLMRDLDDIATMERADRVGARRGKIKTPVRD